MRKTVSLFLFLALMVGASQPAKAQFWKKIFKKEEKKKPKPAPKKPAAKEKTATAKSVKKREIDFPETHKKTRYRVDVFVSLYLDELVKDGKPVYKGRMPDKATPGLDFYQGVQLAADTLNMFGYNVDVFVHDITTAAGAPEAVVKGKGFDTTDIIIGAVQSAQIPVIADFAKKHNINFISALSPSDAGIKNNPYFTLLQPTLQSHCEAIMAAVNKKYKKRQPVIFHRTTTPLDVEAFGYISEQAGDAKKVLVNTMPAKAMLAPLFDSNILNVIVMPVMDHAHAERVLQHLYHEFPAYDFEVYGMPSWKTMSSLKKADAYPNVIVYITTPFYFDPTTASGTQIASSYRQNFGGKPGELVFRGYETMYWYTYLLGKYGTIFNKKLGDNGVAPFTRYEIKPQWNKDDDLLYNENKHLYLYRYQASSYMVEQ